MMRSRIVKIFVTILAFTLFACSAPQAQVDQNAIIEMAILTLEARMTAQPFSPTVSIITQPPVIPPSSTLTPTYTPTLIPTFTSTFIPTFTPTLTQISSPTGQPGEPPAWQSWIVDYSSAGLANEKRTISDYFQKNLLERPFTSQDMEYQPYLDIVKAAIGRAEPWIFVNIFLVSGPSTATPVEYSVEIDQDKDGRGDWLIQADSPMTTIWTTSLVSVWSDSNHNVGGSRPMLSDLVSSGMDGYDKVVSDHGSGSEAGIAWARLDPKCNYCIQIAFKHKLVDNTRKFLWSVWADAGIKQPAWFDYNDHYTTLEAGSPSISSEQYPLKAVASIDNTCRWGYGFKPRDPLPGTCQSRPAPNQIPPILSLRCQLRYVCPRVNGVWWVWNPVSCRCMPP